MIPHLLYLHDIYWILANKKEQQINVFHCKVVYFPCFLHTITYRLGGKNDFRVWDHVKKKHLLHEKRNMHLMPLSPITFGQKLLGC